MELVIAIILIVILLFRIYPSKKASSEYDKQAKTRKEQTSQFKQQYTSDELERSFRGFISDERNCQQVVDKVNDALRGINYEYLWTGILNDSQLRDTPKSQYQKMYEQMLANREIAMDVLLAERGKIASIRTAFGYRAFLNSSNKELKKACFEYAERIMSIINKDRGNDPVMLVYKFNGRNSVYVWDGSQGDKQYGRPYEKRMTFDRALLE